MVIAPYVVAGILGARGDAGQALRLIQHARGIG